MEHIKGTKQEVEEYIAEVDAGEGYIGVTITWDTPQEIEGNWYAAYNVKYPTELEITERPIIEIDEI